MHNICQIITLVLVTSNKVIGFQKCECDDPLRESKNPDVAHIPESLMEDILEIKAWIKDHKNQDCQLAGSQAGVVAFSVSRTQTMDVAVKTPIEFNRVNTNIGGGWQEVNDYQFLTPVSGLYSFTFTGRTGTPTTGTGNTGGDVFLTVNGVEKGSSGSKTEFGGIALSMMLELSQGDEVYLALGADRALQDHSVPCTHFSGFLIHASS